MKKILSIFAVILGLWNLFYIFILGHSFVTEYFESKFYYWGYPQWGTLYETPDFFMKFNVVYLLLLLVGMFLAWKWRANVKKAILPLVVIALLSFANMYVPSYNRSHQFDLYTAEDGTDLSRIPAGKWLVSNQMMESYNDQSFVTKAKGWFGRGDWPGNYAIWGDYRVWLVPGPDTSNEGRRGLVLHGGTKLGSPWGVNMGADVAEFANKLKDIPTPLELMVEY